MSNKSIAQRLQSRISLRRNSIRSLEDHLERGKPLKALARRFPDHPDVDRFHAEYASLKETIRDLAAEQKLDKDLFHRYVCPMDNIRFIINE